MGYWQALPRTDLGFPIQNKCDYFPPNYLGSSEGETAYTNCTKNNPDPVQWVWHTYDYPCSGGELFGGYYSYLAHFSTDINLQCNCLIFADSFDCISELGKWWDVQEGSLTVESDTPKFYGTSGWSWNGSAWILNNGFVGFGDSPTGCYNNCVPVVPTIVPTYDPVSHTWHPNYTQTLCDPWPSHPNQAEWIWSKHNQLWQLNYGYVDWRWNYLYGRWDITNNHCFANCSPRTPLEKPQWVPSLKNWKPTRTLCFPVGWTYCGTWRRERISRFRRPTFSVFVPGEVLGSAVGGRFVL